MPAASGVDDMPAARAAWTAGRRPARGCDASGCDASRISAASSPKRSRKRTPIGKPSSFHWRAGRPRPPRRRRRRRPNAAPAAGRRPTTTLPAYPILDRRTASARQSPKALPGRPPPSTGRPPHLSHLSRTILGFSFQHDSRHPGGFATPGNICVPWCAQPAKTGEISAYGEYLELEPFRDSKDG